MQVPQNHMVSHTSTIHAGWTEFKPTSSNNVPATDTALESGMPWPDYIGREGPEVARILGQPMRDLRTCASILLAPAVVTKTE
jgi:hypothetical protein